MSTANHPDPDAETGDENSNNIVTDGQIAQGQNTTFVDVIGVTSLGNARNLAGAIMNPNDPDQPQPQTKAGVGT